MKVAKKNCNKRIPVLASKLAEMVKNLNVDVIVAFIQTVLPGYNMHHLVVNGFVKILSQKNMLWWTMIDCFNWSANLNASSWTRRYKPFLSVMVSVMVQKAVSHYNLRKRLKKAPKIDAENKNYVANEKTDNRIKKW